MTLWQPRGLIQPNRDWRRGQGSASGVTLNATGTETYQANGASLNYTGISVAAGSNSALLCVLIRAAAVLDPSAGVALSWDSGGTPQAMTLLVSAIKFGVFMGQVWGLRAPTTGNKTLAISWTNAAADNFVSCVAFDGVLQTNDAAAFPHTATDTAGASSITLTSAAGNMVVGAIVNQGGGATVLGTTLFQDAVNGTLINGAADYIDGGTPTVGIASGATSALAGVDVMAA